MEQRIDRTTAVYVDLAVNVATTFGIFAGIRVLNEQRTPLPVVQRVLIEGGPRRGRVGYSGATEDSVQSTKPKVIDRGAR